MIEIEVSLDFYGTLRWKRVPVCQANHFEMLCQIHLCVGIIVSVKAHHSQTIKELLSYKHQTMFSLGAQILSGGPCVGLFFRMLIHPTPFKSTLSDTPHKILNTDFGFPH